MGKRTSDGRYNFIFKMGNTEHRFHRRSIGSAAKGAAALVVKKHGKKAIGKTVSIRRTNTQELRKYKIMSYETVDRQIGGKTVRNLNITVRSLAKKTPFAAAKQRALDNNRQSFTFNGMKYERVLSKYGNPTGLFRLSSESKTKKKMAGKRK